jgi:hypothetical protein
MKKTTLLILIAVVFLASGQPAWADYNVPSRFQFTNSGVQTPTSEILNYAGQVIVDGFTVPWSKCEDRIFTEFLAVNLPENLYWIDLPNECQWIREGHETKLKCGCSWNMHSHKWECNDWPNSDDLLAYRDYITQWVTFVENVCMSGEVVIPSKMVSYSGAVSDDDTMIVTEVALGTPVTAFAEFWVLKAGKYTTTTAVKLAGKNFITPEKEAEGLSVGAHRVAYGFTPAVPGLYQVIFSVRGPGGLIRRTIPLRVNAE